jgi:hypothetical protein
MNHYVVQQWDKQAWRHYVGDVTDPIDPDLIDLSALRVPHGTLYSGERGLQVLFFGQGAT